MCEHQIKEEDLEVIGSKITIPFHLQLEIGKEE